MSASGMAVAGTWMLDKRATELNNGMPEVSASAHVGLGFDGAASPAHGFGSGFGSGVYPMYAQTGEYQGVYGYGYGSGYGSGSGYGFGYEQQQPNFANQLGQSVP